MNNEKKQEVPAVGDVVLVRGQGETDSELSKRAAILAAHHGVPIWCDNKRIDRPACTSALDDPRPFTTPTQRECYESAKDAVRAWILRGEIIIERAEMERVKALGVDIREVPDRTERYEYRGGIRILNADIPPRSECGVRSINERGEEVISYKNVSWDVKMAAQTPCPDCKGSKRYEGLREAGPCLTCGGPS